MATVILATDILTTVGMVPATTVDTLETAGTVRVAVDTLETIGVVPLALVSAIPQAEANPVNTVSLNPTKVGAIPLRPTNVGPMKPQIHALESMLQPPVGVLPMAPMPQAMLQVSLQVGVIAPVVLPMELMTTPQVSTMEPIPQETTQVGVC